MNRSQFSALYQQFLLRVVDLELLSAQGDPTKLLGQFATLLLSFSFLVTLPVLIMGLAGHPGPQLIWTLEHFLIASTMVVVGLFSVLSWDSIFPDRRDILVLAPLPVRVKTLFLAKLAALGAGLSISVLALNGFTGLIYPLLFTPRGGFLAFLFRSLPAYWLTTIMAAAFIFGSVLTIQGVASQLLPRQFFLKISALLQVLTFCLFLSVYILEPSLESRAALTSPQNQGLLASLPSYWFLGLFQQLNGSLEPAFLPLARRAWIGLAIAIVGSVASLLFSYFRKLHKIVEEPDILPNSHSLRLLPRTVKSLENSILLFSLRTITRSRQHRMILSIYMGIGFAISLLLLSPAREKWMDDSESLMTISILFLCIAVVTVRAIFSMPITLKANWLFRVAALHPVASYSMAIRRSFLLLAVTPLLLVFAAFFFSIWPWKIAALHLVSLVLLGSIVSDFCAHGFHKVPFTCSYQPGKANLHFTFWGFIALLPLVRLTVADHWWKALHRPGECAVILLALGSLAVFARWRTRRAARLAEAMQFEELEEPEIISLQLSNDGVLLRNGLGKNELDPYQPPSLTL